MFTSPTYMRLKVQSVVYAITMCCSIGFLLYMTSDSWVGSSLRTSFLICSTSSLLGFLISAYEVGALFGALAEFAVGDRYGRKPNNVVGIIIVTFGAIMQATSFGIAQFLVGRAVAAECTLPKSRGHMMLLGLIIDTWLDSGVSFYASSIQWRRPCAFQCMFVITVLCLIPFLPESPRYLAATGQQDRASHVLAALRGHPEDHPEVTLEPQEISCAIAVESQEAGSWSDVFKDHGISGWQGVLIACIANFIQQMSGVNNSVGLSSQKALLVSGGLQVFYFLSILIPWYVIDRDGRRRLFMLGSMGMGTCMLLPAIFVSIGTKSLGYAAILVLYVFQMFFPLGWQSNMNSFLTGGALSVVSQWLFTFVEVEITPVMINNITYKSYIRPLEMVDLLFADRDGKRPSMFRVVRDSTNKKFERTKAREENERMVDEAKHAVEYLEKSV
ncbi:hypothetical protein V1524DRAFT_444486 [Lipomyces starkeyi]